MASINGLTQISATSIQNAGQIYLGNNLDSGTPGQVIISNGPQQAVSWGSNSATLPGALTAGTNLSLASGNASFDGTVADTLNATALTITGGKGISVVAGTEILTDNDNTTINNSGGTGNQNQVLKVPNALTFTGTATGTYDGSSALSINLTDTDTTYQGSSTININTATNPDTINCLKVPNVMTASTNIIFTNTDDGAAETVYDGSQPITIRATDTDTTYQGSSTISIDTSTNPDTINCLKVPNVITAGTNISMVNTDDGASVSNYDGSEPVTITAASSGTTYAGGTNISIDTSTNPDEINLDTSITGQTGITFLNNGASTNLTGSNYPNKPTTATYLDLSSSTNIISGGVLATKVQRTSLFKSFTSAYGEYSTNFRTSFVAKSTNVMIEFKGIVRADNKVFYGGLYDYNSLAFQADTRNRFNYNDETDQDMTTMTWWMRNLTAGTTYYISPYFRGSSSTVYIYAGHNGGTDGFAPAIMRIYDGGNNVDIY
tara:strand:+ start:1033 stop:2508 length:1476 start_codon:yes stop_codon:yes gene_type:complete